MGLCFRFLSNPVERHVDIMPKKSTRKRLDRQKSRTVYARKKKDLSSEPNSLLPTKCSCLGSESESQKNEETNISPAPVLIEKCMNSPTAMPPPVSVNPSPKVSLELSDCLISPTTGTLRNRTHISFNGDEFEEGLIVNNTPRKSSEGGHPLWKQSPQHEFALSATTLPEYSSTNSQVFTVSSICVIDSTESGIHPCDPCPGPTEKLPKARTPPSISDCAFQMVGTLLKPELPTAWDVAATSTSFILRMAAPGNLWGNIQRSALISTDGTVQLNVHGQPISLDHSIWQDLPNRVCLSNRESVDEFLKFVLQLVKVFRSYEVCIGIPESQYSKEAAKRSDLMFECNYFRESRYTQTYRSKSCKMLLSTNIKITKYCSSCLLVRKSILARFRRTESVHNPHGCSSNVHLDRLCSIKSSPG